MKAWCCFIIAIIPPVYKVLVTMDFWKILLVTSSVYCASIVLCDVPEVSCEQGRRGGSYIYHIRDGLYYHYNVERRSSIYFKCAHYERTGCRGRAVMHIQRGFRHTQPHTHCEPDVHYVDELRLRRNILERCSTLEYVPYRTILLQERRRFNRVVQSRVTLVRLRTAMRNARIANYPPAPINFRALTQILQDPNYAVISMTEDGEDNLYAGSVTAADGSHSIVFASRRMLRFMSSVRTVQSDGTFRVLPSIRDCPHESAQVFVILTTWRHHTLPIAWVLMERRTQEAYTAVLHLIRRYLRRNIVLQRVVTDYETGQRNAWETVFGPGIQLQGCLWHICRAFVAMAVKLGLGAWLRRCRIVRRFVHLTCAIPMLPRRFMLQALVLILRSVRRQGRHLERLLTPYLRYIFETWLRRSWRRSWISVFGSPTRTNNACESHNRILNDQLGAHPNIYAFIGGLVRLEQTYYGDLYALRRGQAASRARRTSAINNDRRIQALSEDLQNPPGDMGHAIWRFLSAASRRVEGVLNEAAGLND